MAFCIANELIFSGVYASGYEILYLNCSGFAESYKELDFWVENLAGLLLLLTLGAHFCLALLTHANCQLLQG
jgi:hypothetical protein